MKQFNYFRSTNFRTLLQPVNNVSGILDRPAEVQFTRTAYPILSSVDVHAALLALL